jgi:hypothetical protein
MSERTLSISYFQASASSTRLFILQQADTNDGSNIPCLIIVLYAYGN